MSNVQRKKLHAKHQPTGCWIRPWKRLAIYLRDRFCCVYCGTDLHAAMPFEVTLDHLSSLSNGTNNSEINLVTACRTCNCCRQDTPWRTFADVEAKARIAASLKRNAVFTKYVALAKQTLAGRRNGQ